MKTKRKVVAKVLPERKPAGSGGGRVFVDGQIIKMLPSGDVILRLRNGQENPCRRPSTIDQGWLRAALVVGPVDAEGTLDLDQGAGSIWCIFPGPEHAEVASPALALVATERVSIKCGKASLSLEKDGSLQVRGRDIVTRGSRSARLSGAIVRIN